MENPFQDNARFDYELFTSHAQKAQRLMDDLIDLEIECVDRIIAKIKKDPESKDAKRVELELQPYHNLEQLLLKMHFSLKMQHRLNFHS